MLATSLGLFELAQGGRHRPTPLPPLRALEQTIDQLRIDQLRAGQVEEPTQVLRLMADVSTENRSNARTLREVALKPGPAHGRRERPLPFANRRAADCVMKPRR